MADVESLYALPPEEFITARDALARQLRDAGKREAAEDVKDRRRPTVAAWAVNLAVRRAPESVDALDQLRSDLHIAQRRLLSGRKGTELATLTRRRRELVDALMAEAEAALTEHGRDLGGHAEDVRATFEAVLGDADAAARVRAGQLERALPPPSGFGTLAGLGVVTDPAPEPPAEQEGDTASARLVEARALRDRLAEAADTALLRAHAAAREADRLTAEADAAAAEATSLQREADAAVARAEQASAAQARAREAAEAASDKARRSQDRAEEATHQLDEAERMVATLREPGR